MSVCVGNYEIVRELSEGSFGRTYIAKHKILGRQVCIKQEKTGVDEYKSLFRREAMILAGMLPKTKQSRDIRHPYLPCLLDYIEDDSFGQMMILSYIQGQPLNSLVDDSGSIDDEHICWILDYLHYRYIVHSDIKPDNIIVDVDEHLATIIDLGVAATSPNETSKAIGGTPLYLPPEFGIGKPPIPASDIYSLGKVACYMAGGDPGNGTLPADMNQKLKDLIDEMCRLDPTARPQNTGELRNRLHKLRKEIFGKTTCSEKFKFRNGKIVK